MPPQHQEVSSPTTTPPKAPKLKPVVRRSSTSAVEKMTQTTENVPTTPPTPTTPSTNKDRISKFWSPKLGGGGGGGGGTSKLVSPTPPKPESRRGSTGSSSVVSSAIGTLMSPFQKKKDTKVGSPGSSGLSSLVSPAVMKKQHTRRSSTGDGVSLKQGSDGEAGVGVAAKSPRKSASRRGSSLMVEEKIQKFEHLTDSFTNLNSSLSSSLGQIQVDEAEEGGEPTLEVVATTPSTKKTRRKKNARESIVVDRIKVFDQMADQSDHQKSLNSSDHRNLPLSTPRTTTSNYKSLTAKYLRSGVAVDAFATPQTSKPQLPFSPQTDKASSARNLLASPSIARSLLASPSSSSERNVMSSVNMVTPVTSKNSKRSSSSSKKSTTDHSHLLAPPIILTPSTVKPSSARDLFESPEKNSSTRRNSDQPPNKSTVKLSEEIQQLRRDKQGAVVSLTRQYKDRIDTILNAKNKTNWVKPLQGRKKKTKKKGLKQNKRNNAWSNKCVMPLTPEYVSNFKAPVHQKNEAQIALIQKAMKQTVVLKDMGHEMIFTSTTATTGDSISSPTTTGTMETSSVSDAPDATATTATTITTTTTTTNMAQANAKLAAETLVNAMEQVTVQNGEVIVEQGRAGEHFYIVEEGQVDFHVDGMIIGTADAGTSFWDLNLLYSAAQSATVVAASEPTKLFRVDQQTYRGIMATTCGPPTLVATSPPTAGALFELIFEEEENDDHDVDKVEGKVVVSTETSSVVEESIVTVMDDHHRKTVEAKRASAFMEKRAAIHAAVQASIGLDDLERISVLGEGQFGEVWLCQAQIEGEAHRFALKRQQKVDDIRCENTEAAIRREMEMLRQLQHPFICELVHTYEDEPCLYMLLGLITGGELWDVIHREDSAGKWTSGLATEYQAKFYALAVADTLTFMHTRRYIFRDLKPENVMLDGDGYPVIVDFGFAKQLPEVAEGAEEAKTFTFCGTPNYVAPEIVKNTGHNAGADHWALGVLIYEMLGGENPFYYDGMDTITLFQAICEEDYYGLGEGKASENGLMLIEQLLKKDATERLGSIAMGGPDCILKHGWFDGLDLEKLRLKELPAPWLPGTSSSSPSSPEEKDQRDAASSSPKPSDISSGIDGMISGPSTPRASIAGDDMAAAEALLWASVNELRPTGCFTVLAPSPSKSYKMKGDIDDHENDGNVEDKLHTPRSSIVIGDASDSTERDGTLDEALMWTSANDLRPVGVFSPFAQSPQRNWIAKGELPATPSNVDREPRTTAHEIPTISLHDDEDGDEGSMSGRQEEEGEQSLDDVDDLATNIPFRPDGVFSPRPLSRPKRSIPVPLDDEQPDESEHSEKERNDTDTASLEDVGESDKSEEFHAESESAALEVVDNAPASRSGGTSDPDKLEPVGDLVSPSPTKKSKTKVSNSKGKNMGAKKKKPKQKLEEAGTENGHGENPEPKSLNRSNSDGALKDTKAKRKSKSKKEKTGVAKKLVERRDLTTSGEDDDDEEDGENHMARRGSLPELKSMSKTKSADGKRKSLVKGGEGASSGLSALSTPITPKRDFRSPIHPHRLKRSFKNKERRETISGSLRGFVGANESFVNHFPDSEF
jgi:serine/threonine protein kinase/CRP-like cAMP-binding protein